LVIGFGEFFKHLTMLSNPVLKRDPIGWAGATLIHFAIAGRPPCDEIGRAVRVQRANRAIAETL
jgi:hypothetical protein